MKLGKPIPILRSFDEAKAKEFYVDFLGFKLDWQHQFEPNTPRYMQVSLGECVLHLSEHFGDCCPGAGLRVRVDDIDGYQQALLAKRYRHSRPGCAERMPWGTRELTIADPFGNRITFYQEAAAAPAS
jgi:catechol 2,3-dioxygenase-like lactoylglutathione lyase family enzyme